MSKIVYNLVVFDPLIGPYQALSLWARVDLEDGNKGVFHILQSSSITGISDCFVSYLGYLLWVGSYLNAEVQLVYSTAPADRASGKLVWIQCFPYPWLVTLNIHPALLKQGEEYGFMSFPRSFAWNWNAKSLIQNLNFGYQFHFLQCLILIILIVLYIDLRPGQTCHSKECGSDTFRWAVMGRNRVGRLGWQYGQGKIPQYSPRLMHRKRVTCELHDSYFCLMTIKHAISKILSEGLNYYITRWRQEVS